MNLSDNSATPLRLGDIIELGGHLERLSSCAEQDALDEVKVGVIERLEAIWSSLKQLDLRDSQELFDNELAPLLRELRYYLAKEGQTTLTGHAEELKRQAVMLSMMVRDDSARRYAYPVKPLKDYEPDELTLYPYRLFGLPDHIFPALPKEIDFYLGFCTLTTDTPNRLSGVFPTPPV